MNWKERIGKCLNPIPDGPPGTLSYVSRVHPLPGLHLNMTIPERHYLVSPFQEAMTREALSVSQPPRGSGVVVPIPAAGSEEFAVQFEVVDDSGGPLVVAYEWGTSMPMRI